MQKNNTKFDENQITAIKHMEGPALVIAGPGSGKTTVITHRIKHLVEHGVEPESIMVVTFSRAAAEEMKTRYEKLVYQNNDIMSASNITFGTFHSIFFKILKCGGQYSADNILRNDEKYTCIRKAVCQAKLNDNIETLTENLVAEISAYRNQATMAEKYMPRACDINTFFTIYNAYDNYKKYHTKIDFDDMLILCNKMLHDNPQLLRKFQNRFKYILIDEFQDINNTQYETIKMIAKPQNNIFAVGDDDQSIYGFRGAKPDIMFEFEREYNNITRINLNINYRSTPEIVQTAGKLIAHNKNRFDKNIQPNAHMSAMTSEHKNSVDIRQFKNCKMQAEAVADEIQNHIGQGFKYSETAILLRNNIQQETITETLSEYNIPFNIKNGKLLSVYNTKTAAHIESRINEAVMYLENPQRYSNEYVHIKKLDVLSKLPTAAAISFVRYGMTDNYINRSEMSDVNKCDEIYEAILETAKKYPDKKQWLRYICEYRRNISERKQELCDGVNILTMHASKGLEYKNVFIISTNEGIMPAEKAVAADEIEEERRIFYVAITRACKNLHIFSVEEIHGKRRKISSYVEEILG